jgi:hypothetical protein
MVTLETLGVTAEQGLPCVLAAYVARTQELIADIRARDPQRVLRVFIPELLNLHSYFELDSAIASRALARTVLQLRYLVRENQCLLHASATPELFPPHILVSVAAFIDTHISIESFAGADSSVPYEFKEFNGLLALHRVQAIGMLAPFRPPSHKYGLKRDRRKLHIEPLHLPPEESRAFPSTEQLASASATSEVKKPPLSVGLACGTGTAAKNFDF